MNHSTISVSDEQYEGLSAEWALCNPFAAGIQNLMRNGVLQEHVSPRTDTATPAINKVVIFLSQFVPESKSQIQCLAWNLPGGETKEWTQKLFLLRVRWLRSLERGEISRPLLSQSEVDELAELQVYSRDRLRSLYSIEKLKVVDFFLTLNSFLVKLLFEACTVLRRFFPEEILSLVHRIDPEVSNDEKLLLYVKTRSPVKETLELLDEFEEVWWIDNLNRANNKLLIDIEFI